MGAGDFNVCLIFPQVLLSWFLFSFCVIIYQLEMFWMCCLNSNKVTKRSKFCRRDIPTIDFGLHVHNHKFNPFLSEYGYQLLWTPMGQAYVQRSDPNQCYVVVLGRVLHWVWGPTHRRAIKVVWRVPLFVLHRCARKAERKVLHFII